MKKTGLYILLLAFMVGSCGGPKQSINYQVLAENAFNEGNYQQAINELNTYIQEQELKGEEPNPKVYSDLAEANFHLKKMNEAERYYNWAMTENTISPELNVKMSKYYRDIDNLSKEITALEYYRDNFSKAKGNMMMRNRLFETYIESENWKKAEKSWKNLDEETRSSEDFVKLYFELNKQLENTEKCDEMARKLLKFDENNQRALEWLAKKYYNMGENRYQKAMDTYNRKKTTKNYNILLKELDQVTADLKKSVRYFDKLWEMEDGKKYAIYLANIYVRFDDKKKADYYKSFIQ